MSWQDAMLADFTRLVRSQGKRYEGMTVKTFEIDADSYQINQGCDTCGYGENYSTDHYIRFYDEWGMEVYTHYGDWTSLMTAINALDN